MCTCRCGGGLRPDGGASLPGGKSLLLLPLPPPMASLSLAGLFEPFMGPCAELPLTGGIVDAVGGALGNGPWPAVLFVLIDGGCETPGLDTVVFTLLLGLLMARSLSSWILCGL